MLSRILLVALNRALLFGGLGALAYAGVLIAESQITQRYETSEFNQALAASANLQTKTVEAGGPIGKLTIPSVGLSAMVLEGDDSRTLNVAPGHIPGTALPGEDVQGHLVHGVKYE
jgi:sortase A